MAAQVYLSRVRQNSQNRQRSNLSKYSSQYDETPVHFYQHIHDELLDSKSHSLDRRQLLRDNLPAHSPSLVELLYSTEASPLDRFDTPTSVLDILDLFHIAYLNLLNIFNPFGIFYFLFLFSVPLHAIF